MRIPNIFTININFPALDSYVKYLEGEQQKQIDALSETVETLTASLTKSSTGLQSTVDQNTQEK